MLISFKRLAKVHLVLKQPHKRCQDSLGACKGATLLQGCVSEMEAERRQRCSMHSAFAAYLDLVVS